MLWLHFPSLIPRDQVADEARLSAEAFPSSKRLAAGAGKVLAALQKADATASLDGLAEARMLSQLRSDDVDHEAIKQDFVISAVCSIPEVGLLSIVPDSPLILNGIALLYRALAS